MGESTDKDDNIPNKNIIGFLAEELLGKNSKRLSLGALG